MPGQESLVESTYFTAHRSSSKPCRVQHSESSGFSGMDGKPHQSSSPFEVACFNSSKSRRSQRLIESFGQNLVLPHNALPLE